MLSRAEKNLLRMQGILVADAVNTTDAEAVIPRSVMAIKWRAEQTTTIKDDAPVLSRAEMQLRKLQGK